MNIRALTLGAVVGFVVAFAPSCSPPKCGPQNCDGCCDSVKNTCVKKPNNNNNTTCGSAGNSCIDCTATSSTCNMGQCSGTGAGGGTTGGGGGTTGGGGGTTCDGCRLPNGSCVPQQTSSSNTSNCGIGGVSCQTCATGELCTNGTCGQPPPMAKVGSSCTSDADCQAGLGAAAKCKMMTTTGNGNYQGGYCTILCGSAACPAGSGCVGASLYGEDDVMCMDNCSGTDPCRAGYACYNAGSSNICWIDPLPVRDAGTPADKVGIACTDDTQCQNPPSDRGLCLTREGNFDWTAAGGYCSRIDCVNNSECSADGGAVCITITTGGSGACVQVCPASSPDAGQSTCRNGYTCEPLIFSDGGWAMRNVCLPPQAPIPTSIGDSCATDMDCRVPAGAIADCLPPTLPDGGPNFPGGSCSRLNCEIDEECSEDGGALCISFRSGNTTFTRCERQCADSMAGQSTCRSGYACEGLGLADGGQTAFGICQPACTAPGVGCPQGQTCNTTTGYCQ